MYVPVGASPKQGRVIVGSRVGGAELKRHGQPLRNCQMAAFAYLDQEFVLAVRAEPILLRKVLCRAKVSSPTCGKHAVPQSCPRHVIPAGAIPAGANATLHRKPAPADGAAPHPFLPGHIRENDPQQFIGKSVHCQLQTGGGFKIVAPAMPLVEEVQAESGGQPGLNLSASGDVRHGYRSVPVERGKLK
jgi:hypothetical protein